MGGEVSERESQCDSSLSEAATRATAKESPSILAIKI
jgi:hypothetical protein